MNAAQFSRELAKLVHRTENQVSVYSRALAEGDERELRGRGRHAGDISTAEGIKLLLALLSGKPAKQAAKAASDLWHFTLSPNQNDDALKAFHYLFGRDNDFERLIKKPFGELLVILSRRVAKGEVGEDNFVYVVVDDAAIASIQTELNWFPNDRSQKLHLHQEISFLGVIGIDPEFHRGFYYERHTATDKLLKWIADNTAAEFQ